MDIRIKPQQAVAVLAALAFAGTLLVLSVPRTIGALSALPGDRILRQIQRGETVDAAALGTLISSRERASAWRRRGGDHADMALGNLVLATLNAERDGPDPEPIRLAVRSLKASLALTPVNPHAWSRLAYAQILRDGPSADVAASIRMSVYLGPHETDLVFSRLRLSFVAWSHLTEEDRELVARQIRFAWKISDEELALLAMATGRYKEIRLALLETPEILADFENVLRLVMSGAKVEDDDGEEEYGEADR